MKDLIYLDNNATTRPAAEVADGVMTALREDFGNPSSGHVMGQRAAFHVAEARRRVASCLCVEPDEIVFTSGGTESDNLAIRGLLAAAPGKRHIVSSSVEHEAVARLLERLQSEGFAITTLKVDREGRLDLKELEATLRDDTALVSIMLANNETGVLLPLKSIAEICHHRNVPVHTDAVQAVGKIRLDLRQLPVDMLSLSAHKFHGPKGVAALFVRRPLQLKSQIIGGFQEQDRRGGTENVSAIVGLGIAAQLVEGEIEKSQAHMRGLRDQIEKRLIERVPNAQAIAAGSPRLPNTSMMAFEGLKAEEILIGLSERGICASGGSACHSGSLEPSGTLQAMGIEHSVALGAVRLSVSRYSTQPEIDHLLDVLPQVAQNMA